MNRKRILLYLGAIAGLLGALLVWYGIALMRGSNGTHTAFDGARAYEDVTTQVAFGPRIPGTQAHADTVEWIRRELEAAGWSVEIQQAELMGHPIRNIRAYRGDAAPQIILGAHYDTRIQASRDPDPGKRAQPVPGADDGASGVAVLLELARTLPPTGEPVWLVFFDAEDNGGIPGWDWLLGSRAFVSTMKAKPRAMVLLDMVGDADLSFPVEANSDPALAAAIWQAAARLGHASVFVSHTTGAIEDDHLPFIEAGIPSVDIIDLNYRYWHTTSDLPEHVSPRSLQIVGDVLTAWLSEQGN